MFAKATIGPEVSRSSWYWCAITTAVSMYGIHEFCIACVHMLQENGIWVERRIGGIKYCYPENIFSRVNLVWLKRKLCSTKHSGAASCPRALKPIIKYLSIVHIYNECAQSLEIHFINKIAALYLSKAKVYCPRRVI